MRMRAPPPAGGMEAVFAALGQLQGAQGARGWGLGPPTELPGSVHTSLLTLHPRSIWAHGI